MDRTTSLPRLEFHYRSLSPAGREIIKTEIRRIYIESYAEDLIRHLEKAANERTPPCLSK